jgi:diguanylate cyclase (GGDEF)-like protein
MGPFRFASRLGAALWMALAAGLAVLGVVVHQSLEASRERHLAQAYAEARNLSRVLEGQVVGLFERVELGLTVLAEATEEQWRRRVPDLEALTRKAQDVRSHLPDLDTLRVADATGILVAGPGVDPANPISIEDRPHFRRLRDEPKLEFTRSDPLVTRLTKRPGVILAHRVSGPDGRFGGVVTTALPIERLEAILGAADIGARGAVSLRAGSDTLIARWPVLEGLPTLYPPPPTLQAVIREGLRTGTFRDTSRIDGETRLYAFRNEGRFGLTVQVGLSERDALAGYRRDARAIVGSALVAAVVAIVSVAALARAWRRREDAMAELAKQASTDALTGLANRRRFFERLAEELARADRYGARPAVLMLDLDRFKAVNDAFGHGTGDALLVHVAARCREALREADLLARVGGEEFAAILPQTDLEGALDAAERVRLAVALAPLPREGGEPLRATLSAGVASSWPGEGADALLGRADEALYEAKSGGRDRVRAWRPAADRLADRLAGRAGARAETADSRAEEMRPAS